jgi:hypothetical protein
VAETEACDKFLIGSVEQRSTARRRGSGINADGLRSTHYSAVCPPERRAAQIREWLLLLLRFAITHDPNDRAVVLSIANEIDSLGARRTQSAPSFFRRTSGEVCNAIVTADDPKRGAILAKHVARIEDLRLRRAFQAAIGLADRRSQASASARQDLWEGLPR